MSVREQLLQYWPRENDVIDCVKTDAEASSEAVSLAVHQPMQFERRLIGGGLDVPSEACDERELLTAFLTPQLPEGIVILPITGTSGAGKSHVVRWLFNKIRSRADAGTRVVIRIPKGTSLKGVLSILLDAAEGPAYDEYRKKLGRAQQDLEPYEAAGLLCERLAHRLETMAKEASARLVANPSDQEARLWDAFCRADFLPSLLRNQQLRSHFVGEQGNEPGPVRRLVDQLVLTKEAGEDDDRKHGFVPDDLLFGEELDRTLLGHAERKAMVMLDQERHRKDAVPVLNAALDGAKALLLQLDPTVLDLFTQVRQQLLSEGKELVLLVEDFAVLSGIQKQLLQVIIKDAIYGGRQQLCTMRTALAYTTGYLDTATVLTRAKVEYRIPNAPWPEEVILDRTTELVAAYINAARLGQEKLERRYRERGNEGEWVPRFEAELDDDATAALGDFGNSAVGYELFPFNREAIHELTKVWCKLDGRVVYNPRFAISNVIHRVLACRDAFARGEFPPATLGTGLNPLPTDAANYIKSAVPPESLDRYRRFVGVWGGNPESAAGVRSMRKRLLDTVGLSGAALGCDGKASRPPPLVVAEPGNADKIPGLHGGNSELKAAVGHPTETEWRSQLEKWRAKQVMPQNKAAELRRWVAKALEGHVDLGWDLYKPRRGDAIGDRAEQVYIPRAQGNAGLTEATALIAVGSDADLEDEGRSAHLCAGLMAVIKCHAVYKGAWDYEGADEDLARYTAFVASRAKAVRVAMQRSYFKREWDPTPCFAQGLLVGARALGYEGAERNGRAELIETVFRASGDAYEQTPNQLPVGSAASAWADFQKLLNGCRRPIAAGERSWRDQLADIVGARQGQGDKVFAVDYARLVPALEAVCAKWAFETTFPKSDPTGVAEFPGVKRLFQELRAASTVIDRERKRMLEWRERAYAWFGDIGDKEDLLRVLRDTVEEGKANGAAKEVDLPRLAKDIEALRGMKLKAALDECEQLSGSADRGGTLAVLGRGYQHVASATDGFMERYDAFLQAVEAYLVLEETKHGPKPVEDAVKDLAGEMKRVLTLVKGDSGDRA